MVKKQLILALACLCVLPMGAAENLDSVPNYRRSSLYTFLVRSDAQDAKLEQEVENTNEFTALASSMVKKDQDTTATAGMSKAKIAQKSFLEVEIPTQFNDHNLSVRVLDFDNYSVTDEEVKTANESQGTKKKKGFGKFAKGLGSAALGSNSAIIQTDTVENKLAAVLLKFFEEQKTAPMLVGKWYNYTDSSKYNMELIFERGMQDASEQAKAEALASERGLAAVRDAGVELIGNTFVIGVNLRYRSNKAVIAEAQKMADAVGGQFGGIGALVSKVAGASASAIAGEGFSVQAVTYLYQLEWNEDILRTFEGKYWDKPIEELVASGMCKLKFIGKDRSRASVSQSIFSKKSESELVKRAVARAIDEAICKLQRTHEVFRTKAPVTRIDESGKFLYAQIGMKEGLEEKDEYTILEAVEDENGKTTYNEVGTAVVEKGSIWDNRYGAADELAEVEAEAAEGKKVEFDSDAVNLGETKFKFKSKADLYPGMLLRLKKKK